ncbi:hypothetical protein ACHAXT_011893 [Thalassiosira profunda]
MGAPRPERAAASIRGGKRALLPGIVQNGELGRSKLQKIGAGLQFHASCASQCHLRAYNSSSTFDSGLAAKQIAHFGRMGEDGQVQFLKASNAAALVLRDRHSDVTGSPVHYLPAASTYCLPIAAKDEGSAILCRKCMQKNLMLTRRKMQSLAGRASKVGQDRQWKMLTDVHAHLAGRTASPNVAVVASREELEKDCRNVITFHNPQFNSTTNLMQFDETIDVVGGSDQFSHTLHGPLVAEPGSVIVTSKSELEDCKNRSNGKLRFRFVTIDDSAIAPDDEVVILAIWGCVMEEDIGLDPGKDESELVDKVKSNIVAEGMHHGCRGIYAGNGCAAQYHPDLVFPFKYLPTASTEDIASYESFHQDVRRFTARAIDAIIGTAGGYPIANSASRSTRQNQECAEKLNALAKNVRVDPIDLRNMDSDGVDLTFPNDNLCQNAETRDKHNEDDMGAATKAGRFFTSYLYTLG